VPRRAGADRRPPRGVAIFSELDLGFRALAACTRHAASRSPDDGKTTTTALVAHLLSAAGLQSTTAGTSAGR